MKPFLIRGLGIVLKPLSRVSLFELLLSLFRIRKQDISGLTELWVILNLLLSLFLLKLVSSSSGFTYGLLAMIYGCVRLFEIVVFQFYTQIYGGYRGKKPSLYYTVESYRRSIVLAGLLYLEVIIWFAAFYRLNGGSFGSSKLHLDSFFVALYYSIVTMTTIGYGDISPIQTPGLILVSTQALIGIFMTILVLSRIISYIPKPWTEDEAEKNEKAHREDEV